MALDLEDTGVLGTLAAVATTPDSVRGDGCAALFIEVEIQGTATAAIQQKLGAFQAGYRRCAAVDLASGNPAATSTVSTIFRIDTPVGEYRGEVTAHTAGNVIFRYHKQRAA